MKRCFWCNMKNPKYIEYHDSEWGRVNFDDGYIFEMILLESFQAGLSWECVLNKREGFRVAFDNFDYRKIANYQDEKLLELYSNSDIIKNKLKISAAKTNAAVYVDLLEKYGSFENYLRQFWDGEIIYDNKSLTSPLSDKLSADLKKRGMKFFGSTIAHSFLQAIGVVYSHDDSCFLFKEKKD